MQPNACDRIVVLVNGDRTKKYPVRSDYEVPVAVEFEEGVRWEVKMVLLSLDDLNVADIVRHI